MILVESKEECCACGACENICPKKAIVMQEDEYGFKYPQIDTDKCIECGLCKQVCAFKKQNNGYIPQKVYAAASKNKDILKKAASGGIFSALATSILRDGGIVFGAALLHDGKTFLPMHISIDNVSDLYLLQGSKYVQSDTGRTYSEAKKYLEDGKKVLYSGTPCQIAGLKSFLRKEYSNLVTVDVICHGVPNKKWFDGYIQCMEKKLKGKIKKYIFRDKSYGQGMHTRIDYIDSKNEERKIVMDGYLTSYFYYFLKSMIYRENCYVCPYANSKRVSDITIGDFWGVEEIHAEEIKKYEMSSDTGISCILVNSEKGNKLILSIKNELEMLESTFNKVAAHNAQLKAPSERIAERDNLMNVYLKEGFYGVDRYYLKHTRKERGYYKIKRLIPKRWKDNIKKFIHKLKNR